MTPPMPTDETPSAGAVARAEEIMGWYPLSLQRPWSEDAPEYDEQWRLAVARELDRFAREREAAVWEEAAKVLDKCSAVIPVSTADESIYAAQLAIKVALTAIGIELRTRAAEKR